MRKSKADAEILDWRSTGRRRARRMLFEARIDFSCVGCNATTKVPPKDAPSWFNDIWPEENRTASQLQADHTTKDVTMNDIDDLCWRCPSCHKIADMATSKGIGQEADPHGIEGAYGGFI
jgi:hypothetical protein